MFENKFVILSVLCGWLSSDLIQKDNTPEKVRQPLSCPCNAPR